MNIEKKCQYCGGPVTLRSDPNWPENWSRAIASVCDTCDPCGDFYWRRLRLREAIQRTCISLAAGSDKPEEKITNRMVRLTRELTSLLCKWYRIPAQWEGGLVEMLMSTPQHCLKTLDTLEAGIKSAGEARNSPAPVATHPDP